MEQDGAAHILSRLTDRAAGKWQALREQYRKQKIVTVIAPYPDGLWAADVRDGKFLRKAFIPWNGPADEDGAAEMLRLLSAQGFSRRNLILAVNGADLRIQSRRFPDMTEQELAESMVWEEDRMFRLPGPVSMAWEKLSSDFSGCEVLVAGAMKDRIFFWEKAARKAGKRIIRAVPAAGFVSGEKPAFTLCAFRKRGVLLCRSGAFFRRRSISPKLHGEGLYFMKRTAEDLAVTDMDFSLLFMGDCGPQDRAFWRRWTADELAGKTGPAETSEASEETADSGFFPEREDDFEEFSPDSPEDFSDFAENPEETAPFYGAELSPEETEGHTETDRPLRLHWEQAETESEEDGFREGTEPMLLASAESAVSFPLTLAGAPFLTRRNAPLRTAQGLLAVSLLVLGLSGVRYGLAAEALHTARAEAVSLAPVRAEQSRVRAEEKQDRDLTVQLRQLEAENPHWENRLLSLSDRLPSGTVLNSLTVREKQITLRGTASDYGSLEKFRAALEKDWHCRARISGREPKGSYFTFTLICEEEGQEE